MALTKCEDCKYYLSNKGECHRYPPEPVVVNVTVIDKTVVWPITEPNDKCGEGTVS